MVAIGLPGEAVARVRFAVSALWEVVASLRVLRDPGRHAVHLPWARKIELPGGFADSLLWRLVPREPAYLPDFLTPPPPGLAADLEAELELLSRTPHQIVAEHLALGETPAGDPDIVLRTLAAEIRAYWQTAIAPHWARMRLILDAEVHGRARALAAHGAGGLLNDLHDQVVWADQTLSIMQRHCTAPDIPDGPGLVLVPSVFVWPSVLSVADPAGPQLAYPARGVGTLWEARPAVPGALAAVLGKGRASLLAAMAAPASTSELARRTGITAGGVSQHLAALRAAGLVVTHRSGRAVLNARTVVAEALLAASA